MSFQPPSLQCFLVCYDDAASDFDNLVADEELEYTIDDDDDIRLGFSIDADGKNYTQQPPSRRT